jgi:hypothetical protein
VENLKMVATYHNIYDSLADLIAGMDAQRTLSFHAPIDLQERVEILVEKKKENVLSERESEELEHYFILEHIVRLAKSKARLKLKQAA